MNRLEIFSQPDLTEHNKNEQSRGVQLRQNSKAITPFPLS